MFTTGIRHAAGDTAMKPSLDWIRLNARWVVLALALFSVSVGTCAIFLASALRLDACHMCIFQRLSFFVGGVFLLCAAFQWNTRALRATSVMLSASAYLWGAIVAAKQSWLQWYPASGLHCGISNSSLTERIIDWLGERWPMAFMATGDCGSKDLVIAGLSLANWSVLLLLSLFGSAVLALVVPGLPTDDRGLFKKSRA